MCLPIFILALRELCRDIQRVQDDHDSTNEPRTQSIAEEAQFQTLWQKIIAEGEHHVPSHDHVQGSGTRSLFGYQMKFSLMENGQKVLPISTIRSMPVRHVFEELMWMLRGETNTKELEKRGVWIWSPNSTRAFLDSRGLLGYSEGELGPVYGHQFRHFGAPYPYDEKSVGTDQVAALEQLLDKDPESRRLILTAWNPSVLDQVALPACHVLYQFRVIQDTLHCHFYQRSSDSALAGMWNVTFASLLTHLLAHNHGYLPGSVIVSYGDVHLYENQLSSVRQLLNEKPQGFPKFSVRITRDHVWEYNWEDIHVTDVRAKKIVLAMNA